MLPAASILFDRHAAETAVAWVRPAMSNTPVTSNKAKKRLLT